MRRRALMVAGAALLVALAAFSVSILTADERSREERPPAEQAFLAELRDGGAPRALRARSDDELVVRGRRFCTDLRETGSSLRAVFRQQVAGETYEGQGAVATAARRRLCPHLPDADA